MQIRTGVDIIEVERIKKGIEESGDLFLNKLFTPVEIEYCDSKNISKFEHYSGRFAAKEAIFKAISTTLDNKYSLTWKNMEITNDEEGKPLVRFVNLENEQLRKDLEKVKNIDISISHIKENAVGVAVAEIED